jgi:FAD synthase
MVKGVGRWLKGVAVIGMKDKRRGGKKVEMHILDFNENIYGWYVEAELVLRMRALKEHKTSLLLAAQIKKDIMQARKVLR